MHILGVYPYIRLDSVKAELEATDPDPEASWGRQRLDYQLKARKDEMLKEQQRGKRPSEGSPSDGNLTEGLTTNFLGFDGVDAHAPAAAAVNPLGGRPLGSTIAASRETKKVRPSLYAGIYESFAIYTLTLTFEGERRTPQLGRESMGFEKENCAHAIHSSRAGLHHR